MAGLPHEMAAATLRSLGHIYPDRGYLHAFCIGYASRHSCDYLLIGVWFLAALGAAIKFALPGRLDRLSIAVYLAMGWSGVILWSDKDALLPSAAFGLLTAGACCSRSVSFSTSGRKIGRAHV